jgi:hypothetical protein
MATNKGKSHYSTGRLCVVPMYLFPTNRIPKLRWELLPGIWLEQIGKKLAHILYQDLTMMKRNRSAFLPNYAVIIEPVIYDQGICSRILAAGNTIPPHPFQSPAYLATMSAEKKAIDRIEPAHVARMVLINLIIHNGMMYKIAENFQCEFSEPRTFTVGTGYGIAAKVLEEGDQQSGLPAEGLASFNRERFVKTLNVIEPYYRPYIWSMDRMSLALSSMADAFKANSSLQTYMSLSIVLEALLSTNPMEIPLQIAERGAMLLARKGTKRIELYAEIKKLYNVWSKIVHGRHQDLKGRATFDTLLMSPKLNNAPRPQLIRLTTICLTLVRTLLLDDDYMSLISASGNEDTISRSVDKHFLKLLLC